MEDATLIRQRSFRRCKAIPPFTASVFPPLRHSLLTLRVNKREINSRGCQSRDSEPAASRPDINLINLRPYVSPYSRKGRRRLCRIKARYYDTPLRLTTSVARQQGTCIAGRCLGSYVHTHVYVYLCISVGVNSPRKSQR